MSALPRYRRIMERIRARIAEGTYPVGGVLPAETELCAEFAVSRYTMREALRLLVEQGMLSRRQKAGTVVVSRHPRAAYVQSIGTVEELFQHSVDTHLTVIDRREVPAPPAPVPPDDQGPWHRIDGLRRTQAEGAPFCFNRSFIPGRLAGLALERPGSFGPFYAMLAERAEEPIEQVVQEITAGLMPEEVWSSLGLPPDTIGMCVHRRYLSRVGVLIASFNWYEASRFVYRMELERSRGPAAGPGRGGPTGAG
ncbi:GntR family transcriptional regulator [Muricoccus nepalensis]|uniref:GntR family transcriptional regulator n=1 Tax=Muricoccus nepalensis TaxID=1854500 RepID=UPI001386EEFC|nr:GntR family transcriptional regulator [Roseomonas nepalensis]